MTTEKQRKPSIRSDLSSVHDWFKSQPTYSPKSCSHRLDGLGAVTALNLRDNQFHISLNSFANKMHCTFSMYMNLDENGEVRNLKGGEFCSWVEVGNKVYKLTYKQRNDKPNLAYLADIVEQVREDYGHIQNLPLSNEEKVNMAQHLENDLGFLIVVNYGRTAKHAMLARTEKDFNAPFVR